MWAFQSTLPRRERPCQGRPSASCHWHFNPRSREGSDGTGRQPRPSCPEFQSTLPRRERRFRCRRVHPVPRYFNPRSREGSDLRDLARKRRSNEFQSTLPRRERPAVLDQLGGDRHFNPRSREGSDTPVAACLQAPAISIHAPAKGATAKITKTIPNDFGKINNYNNSFA